MAKCATCGKCRCECTCTAEATRKAAERIVAAIRAARPVIQIEVKTK
jgi:hypothetical protein